MSCRRAASKKMDCAVDIAVTRHRKGVLSKRRDTRHQALDPAVSIEQGRVCMQMEVSKLSHGSDSSQIRKTAPVTEVRNREKKTGGPRFRSGCRRVRRYEPHRIGRSCG